MPFFEKFNAAWQLWFWQVRAGHWIRIRDQNWSVTPRFLVKAKKNKMYFWLLNPHLRSELPRHPNFWYNPYFGQFSTVFWLLRKIRVWCPNSELRFGFSIQEYFEIIWWRFKISNFFCRFYVGKCLPDFDTHSGSATKNTCKLYFPNFQFFFLISDLDAVNKNTSKSNQSKFKFYIKALMLSIFTWSFDSHAKSWDDVNFVLELGFSGQKYIVIP